MSRRGAWMVALVLGGAGLLAAPFFSTFERREVNEITLPSAAVLTNPYFALEQVLHRLGVPATSATALDGAAPVLGTHDTLLLDVDPARLDAATAARLLAWARAGGHLLLATDRLGTSLPPLVADFGVVAGPVDKAVCRPWDARDGASKWCGRPLRLRVPTRVRVDDAIGDASGGYLLAQLAAGRGHLTLVPNFQPLRGMELKQADHQRLALRLLAPNWRQGRVLVVPYLDGASFPQTVFRRGWPALLALATLLLAWAAMRSARLGPLLPVPVPHRRALLEHVQAAGEFLYRRDLGVSLHRLACEAVLARLRRRDPGLAALHGAALHARLGERSGLGALQVAQAFESPAGAPAFCHAIRVLAQLRSHA